MRLPPFTGDTSRKLARAGEDFAAVEKTLADLRRDREAMLADGDVVDVEKVDQQIANYERQLAVFQQRIPLLEARLATEQAAQRKADREKAIARAAEILPARMKACYELARWARDGVGLVAKLQEASKLRDWPAGLEKPFLSDIDPGRFLAALASALTGFGQADWNPDSRIEDAVAIQREAHVQIIDDLKLAPMPTEVAA
jgi:hypothetical protein